MKKLVTVIASSSSLFSDSAFAKRGEPFTVRKAMEEVRQLQIPPALHGDEVLAPLIDKYVSGRTEFRKQYQALRKQIANASEEEKTALGENLQNLMRSSHHAMRDLKRAVRERMRQLRLAGVV